MKRIILLSIVVSSLVLFGVAHAQIEPLVLSKNQTHVIHGVNTTLNGFTVSGNSSLVILDSHIKMEDAQYVVNGSASLTIINSTLKWQGKGGIRLHDEAETEVLNSTIYLDYELGNRTYYGQGFGLSEKTQINALGSSIGYIKLTNEAMCNVSGGMIGEFGSTSTGNCLLSQVTLGSLILTYEETWIGINSTLQRDLWETTDIVKNGNNTYPVKLDLVTLVHPPSFQLVDCNFEANNTEVDLLLIGGNSGLTVRNVNMTLLYLIEDLWATIIESKLDVLRCRNGDFNVKITGAQVGTLETMMTTGFNLKLLESSVGNLNLMYAHPEAPNNVEIINTMVENLYLSSSSPPVYMFDGSTVQDRLVLETGDGSSQPSLLTGSLVFEDDCRVEHDEREGITELTRVYMVTVDNATTPDTEYMIVNDNHTIKTGTIGENNLIVFPIKYRREYSLIENPQQGGPYLIDDNNFTTPITLHIDGQSVELGLTSNTPIQFSIKKEIPNEPEPEPTQTPYTPLTIITALAAIGILGVTLRKGKTFTPSDQTESVVN